MSAAESISPRTRGLKAYLEDAARDLRENPPDRTAESEDDGAVLYFGNWQDSHPRELLYADELGPTDKLAWMVIKANSDPRAPAGFPSYDEFGRAGIGSRPTIAAAIAMLRITRWISLCDRVRDDRGRYRGCVYALHDEPVSVTEALYLDDGYISFLEDMTDHGHRRVRDTARAMLDRIHSSLESDPDVTEREGVGDRFERRLATHHPDEAVRAAARPVRVWGSRKGPTADGTDHPGDRVKHVNSVDDRVKNPNSVPQHRVKNLNSVENDQKCPEKTIPSYRVKNLNSARARGGSSSFIKPTTTDPTPGEYEQPGARDETEPVGLHYPEGFGTDHRKLAAQCLRDLPADLAQQVLDEVAGAMRDRAQTDPIRNPLRYLSAVAQRARGGEFVPSYAVDAAERRRRKAEQAEREARIEQASVRQAEEQIATVEPDEDNELVKRLQKARNRSIHPSNPEEGT